MPRPVSPLRDKTSPLRRLIHACRAGDVAAAAAIHAEHPQVMHERGLFHATTAAVHASGSVEMVRWMLDHGADVNAAPFHGPASAHTNLERPLHWAASVAPIDVVRLLLDRGADVEGCQKWCTPLLHALRAGRTDVARLLRKRGAREHFLTRVAAGNFREVARVLHADPSRAHQADEYGTTALHLAAELWDVELVNLLLKHGADVHAVDAHRETVLHRLAVRLFDEVLFAWLDKPADTMHRRDPRQQIAVARRLVKAGADVNARNWRKLTPLHRAVRAGRVGFVRFLIENGADVNAADVAGDTPLRRAVTDVKRLAVAALLIESGADLNATTRQGRSVVSLARNPEMKRLLMKAGAAG
jgi:ankyrin repeat protein